MQDVAERLAGTQTKDDVARTVVGVVREAVGAGACTFGIVTDDRAHLTFIAVTGVTEATEAMVGVPVPFEESAAAPALRTGQPVIWESLADRDRHDPRWKGWPSDHQAWVIMPMAARGETLGAVTFGWTEERRFRAEEIAVIGAVAHQCALALDRAALIETEREEYQTLALLAEGTRLMISSLRPEEVVERLTRIAVPRLAEWCAVYIVEADMLRPVGLSVRGLADASRLLAEAPSISIHADSGLARCARTGETVFVPDVPPSQTQNAGGLAADVLNETPIRSGVAVPIVASDRRVGVLMLAFSDSRAYTEQLRFAAEGLAARAGIALANAQSFQHEHHVAQLLTRALLPAELPKLPGYGVAARYLPAGDPVAGDWYDVLGLPSGDYLIGLGDVGGHGVEAASTMAEFRNAARGMAITGTFPARIIDGLAVLAESQDIDLYATAVYGVLEPEAGRFAWSSAGHLPVVSFDHRGVTIERRPQRPPIGTTRSAPAPSYEIAIPPGGGVVLLTDGVLERRRGPSIDDGLEAVAKLVDEVRGDPVDAIADQIVGAFCDGREDDCCIVVLRRDG